MKLIYPIATVLLIVVIIGSVAGGNPSAKGGDHGYFFKKIIKISPRYKEVPILFLIPYIMLFVVIYLWITDKDTDTYNNN